MRLEDMKKSISQLSTEEVFQLISERRASRRVQKTGGKGKKKQESKKKAAVSKSRREKEEVDISSLSLESLEMLARKLKLDIGE